MTRHAREAVSLGVATAIGEVALLALATDWSSVGAGVPLFAFLIGPALFVALLAWRRREHATSVSLAQWAVVGAVWVWLVIAEAREKRAWRQAARAAEAPKPPASTNPPQSA